MERQKIIDLSKWNVVTDYTKLKEAGVQGAIVKVINSANSIDGRLKTHVEGLRAAGIPIIGGYNYLYANNTDKATAVAPAFFKLCNQYDIPFGWMDIEDECMKNIGAQMPKIIDIYKYYSGYYNVKLGIYTGTYFYNKYMKKYQSQIGNLSYWIARYPNTKENKVSDPVPTMPTMPQGISIEGWQYTSKCVIPGIKGYADMSVWFNNDYFVSLTPDVINPNANPYTEPKYNVSINCTIANDINWVKWNLWRQGFFGGDKHYTEICDGIITKADVVKIQMSQTALGLEADGIVGKITRSVWKKLVE